MGGRERVRERGVRGKEEKGEGGRRGEGGREAREGEDEGERERKGVRGKGEKG